MVSLAPDRHIENMCSKCSHSSHTLARAFSHTHTLTHIHSHTARYAVEKGQPKYIHSFWNRMSSHMFDSRPFVFPRLIFSISFRFVLIFFFSSIVFIEHESTSRPVVSIALKKWGKKVAFRNSNSYRCYWTLSSFLMSRSRLMGVRSVNPSCSSCVCVLPPNSRRSVKMCRCCSRKMQIEQDFRSFSFSCSRVRGRTHSICCRTKIETWNFSTQYAGKEKFVSNLLYKMPDKSWSNRRSFARKQLTRNTLQFYHLLNWIGLFSGFAVSADELIHRCA